MCIFQETLSYSAFMLSKRFSFHSALFHFIAPLFFLHSAFIFLHSALSKYPKCESALHYFSKCESALYYFSKCESARYLILFSKNIIQLLLQFLDMKRIISWSCFDYFWYFSFIYVLISALICTKLLGFGRLFNLTMMARTQ